MHSLRRAALWVCALALVVTSCGDNRSVSDAPGSELPAPAMLAIDRASHQFGSVTVGTISTQATFTITNTGATDSGMIGVALTGSAAAGFALPAGSCTGPLAPSASCQVIVLFAPSTAGIRTASLNVTGMPGGTVSASLDGEGIALGALSVTTSTSALGRVVVGQTGTIVSTFTVTNTGGTPTGPLSVFGAGSDPADFTKRADTCATVALAPAAICTFEVRFAPQSAGPKSALFQLSATPGGSVGAAIDGTGLAPANLRAIPLQLDLGSVVTMETSATLAVTVSNLGDEPTGTLGQTISGPDAAMFAAVSGTCDGAMLAAGATCTVTLQLSPTSLGAKVAQLELTGSPGGAVAVLLVGEGIRADRLSISPSTHGFPITNVGQTGSAQLFTITNNATSATGPLTAALDGTAPLQYQVGPGSDACTGVTLAPAASCTISVAFAPTSGGVEPASLTVAGSPGGVVSAGLTGVGVSAAALASTPTERQFGSVVTGTMSSSFAFTVTNTGGQVSGAPTVMLTGAQFAIAGNTCTAMLAPAASCTIWVRFAPTATGAAAGALDVSATPGGTVMGELAGDGIAAGGLVILPSSSTFPVTSVGDGAAARTLTLQNTGTATTGTIAITTTGVDAGDFTTTTTCATLAAGATCTVAVTFTPTATGARTATIAATGSPGGTATAAVAGTGRPRLEIVGLDSGPVVDPADLGTAIVNNTSPHDLLILVRNNTATVKLFSITGAFGSPSQYAVIRNTCGAGNTIGASGGLCTVGVRFAPTTTGTKPGSVTFAIGSGALNQATQNLTGVGVEALTITALAGATFGSVPIGTTASVLQFRVTNPAGSASSGTIATSLSGGEFLIVANACTGQTLAAGGSCLIEVRFAPTTIGAASTVLTATAAPGGAPSIAITGTGVSPTGAAPTDLTLMPSSVAEGLPASSTVGTLMTTDADVGDMFVYSLIGGVGSADNAAFTIAGDLVQTSGVFDFETKSSYAIRIRVTDSGGQTFEEALAITVTNVDEAPVAVSDGATVLEDSAATSLDVLANDTDVDGGPMLIASVTQPARGTVVITGSGSGLTYQPAGDHAGPDSFSYTLNGGASATVTVTVIAVNDMPTFTKGADQTVTEDDPAQMIAGWATAISTGPADEAAQTVTFGVTSDNISLFGAQPAVDADGTLRFTPAAGANGSATVTVTLQDNGGTANGGIDTSAPQMFAIAITAVNDAPEITSTAPTTATEDTPYTYSAARSDADGPGQTWSLLGTHSCGGAIAAATGVFTFTPAGPTPPASCVVAIRVCDGGSPDLCASQTTTVTICDVSNTCPAGGQIKAGTTNVCTYDASISSSYVCPGGYTYCGGTSCKSNSIPSGCNHPCTYYHPCNGVGSPPFPAGDSSNNGQTSGAGSCSCSGGGACYWVNNGTATQCEYGGVGVEATYVSEYVCATGHTLTASNTCEYTATVVTNCPTFSSLLNNTSSEVCTYQTVASDDDPTSLAGEARHEGETEDVVSKEGCSTVPGDRSSSWGYLLIVAALLYARRRKPRTRCRRRIRCDPS